MVGALVYCLVTLHVHFLFKNKYCVIYDNRTLKAKILVFLFELRYVRACFAKHLEVGFVEIFC